jgi:phage terminase large subunit-like protein
MSKIIHPLTFIDKLVKRNELGQPFRLMDHQREVLRLAFAFDKDGRLPWDVILFSTVKKSGKTTLNAALTLAWAFTQEAPNEILVLATTLNKAARVFQTMEGIIGTTPNCSAKRSAETSKSFSPAGAPSRQSAATIRARRDPITVQQVGTNCGATCRNPAADCGKT